MQTPARYAGFSYVEVLVATVLIMLALVPAMEALRTGIDHNRNAGIEIARRYALVEHFETVLAQPYESLLAAVDTALPAAEFSDPEGVQERKLVWIRPYYLEDADGDADPFTGTGAHLLWVQVELEGTLHRAATLVGP